MYKDLLFDFHSLEERFKHDEYTLSLLKPLHNKMMLDYPREEVIEELFHILSNMQTYRNGWNDAVDDYKIYDHLNYL